MPKGRNPRGRGNATNKNKSSTRRKAKKGTPPPNTPPANTPPSSPPAMPAGAGVRKPPQPQNWLTGLFDKYPTLAPVATAGGALGLGNLIFGGDKGAGVRMAPDDPRRRRSGGGGPSVEPLPAPSPQPSSGTPSLAQQGDKIAVNPQGQQRAQRETTPEDLRTGNVPWGTVVNGAYVSPNFQKDVAGVVGLDGLPNQRAISDIEAMNAKGRPTAAQWTRDLNAQAVDPNSPLMKAMALHRQQTQQSMERHDAARNRAIMESGVQKTRINQLLNQHGGDWNKVWSGLDVLEAQDKFNEQPNQSPSSLLGYADGGYVSKQDGVPVNAGRDNRMIAAQDGEFVLSRRAVEMLGLKNLEQLNRMAAGPDANVPTDNDGLMGYADGGEVEGMYVHPYEQSREWMRANAVRKRTPLDSGGLPMQRLAVSGVNPESYNSMMRDKNTKAWENDRRYMAMTNAQNLAGAEDFVNAIRQTKNAGGVMGLLKDQNLLSLNPFAEGATDISGLKNSREMLKNIGKKASTFVDKDAGIIQRTAAKVSPKLVKGAKVGGAVANKAFTAGAIWDAVAAPIAELTGYDYTIDNAIANAADPREAGQYHTNIHGKSPKFNRSMAIAGTNNPDELSAWDKARGAMEAMGNELMAGGYDAARSADWSIGGRQWNPFYQKGYAAKRGIDPDPLGAQGLGEWFGENILRLNQPSPASRPTRNNRT